VEETDKKAAVLRAAIEIVGEQGFHGAPMVQIAERAHVGTGTIYRYFADKDAVIRAAVEQIQAGMLAAALADYPAGEPVRTRFLHLANAWLRYAIDRPMEFRYLRQFMDSPYGIARRRAWLPGGSSSLLTDLFREGQEQKVIKELPALVLVALGFEPLARICADIINGLLADEPRLIASTCDACWDALKREPLT